MTGSTPPVTNRENRPTSLVLGFHGLGMCPKVFEGALRESLGSPTPCVRLCVPEAPTKPVTYLDGQRLRRWFDIERTPLVSGTEHAGLSDSVAFVHQMVREAEESGIPADRIMLVGFSQGAVLALAAGLTYEYPLGGICAFSGWLPAGLMGAAKHQHTPIFMSHGDQDKLIHVSTALSSAWTLKDAGYTNLKFQRHSNIAHTFGNTEQKADLEEFLLSQQSRKRPRSDMLPRATCASPDTVSTNVGSDREITDDESATSDEEDTYQGCAFWGELLGDGKIHWDDGDVWTRCPTKVQQMDQAANATVAQTLAKVGHAGTSGKPLAQNGRKDEAVRAISEAEAKPEFCFALVPQAQALQTTFKLMGQSCTDGNDQTNVLGTASALRRKRMAGCC